MYIFVKQNKQFHVNLRGRRYKQKIETRKFYPKPRDPRSHSRGDTPDTLIK